MTLPHCTPTLGGHSPACDRDGTYCALASTHAGPCRPHGVPGGMTYRCGKCGQDRPLTGNPNFDAGTRLLHEREDDRQKAITMLVNGATLYEIAVATGRSKEWLRHYAGLR